MRSTERFPDKIVAIVDPDSGAISYAELSRAVNSVAHALASTGIREGDRVGICAPKSIGTVAAILGVLRVGAAYVPVDSTAPTERNRFIFEDCSVHAILAPASLIDGLAKAFHGPEPNVAEKFKPLHPLVSPLRRLIERG